MAAPTPTPDVADTPAQSSPPEPPKTTEPAVVSDPTPIDQPSNTSTDTNAIPSGTSPTDIDALVARLYDPIVRKLKAELRLDRERAGTALDLTL
ncbi:hypothetical protein [Nocardia pseudovaccinii]|uniref:hypothetical protein n=1 Tax=Nocardia pseudovaccinii TaxID=189540 RepID=UPI0007A3B5A0|nr:hypothetical protein [Nocardia pseudovaccinii]